MALTMLSSSSQIAGAHRTDRCGGISGFSPDFRERPLSPMDQPSGGKTSNGKSWPVAAYCSAAIYPEFFFLRTAATSIKPKSIMGIKLSAYGKLGYS